MAPTAKQVKQFTKVLICNPFQSHALPSEKGDGSSTAISLQLVKEATSRCSEVASFTNCTHPKRDAGKEHHASHKTYITIELLNIRLQYIDCETIMHNYGVSRATAYRYMNKVPNDCKIKLLRYKQKPVIMCQRINIDCIHKAAKPGNPKMRKTP